MKTVIGPDIEGPSSIKGIACIPRVACVDVDVKYSQQPAVDLGLLIQRLTSEDIRICSFETTSTRWRFVFPQHEVKRSLDVIKTIVPEATYAYHAAMLSFIGCRDGALVRSMLGQRPPALESEMHVTSSSTHMLTQRADISHLLDELMTMIVKQQE